MPASVSHLKWNLQLLRSFFLSLSYALFLTDGGFIVQQKRDDARRFLKFLHPELGLGMSCLPVYSLFVA